MQLWVSFEPNGGRGIVGRANRTDVCPCRGTRETSAPNGAVLVVDWLADWPGDMLAVTW